jgi:gas vesicle protein
MKAKDTLITFAVGVATGAVLGILFAPDSGKNTRDKLSYRLDKLQEKIKETIQDLMKQQEEAISSAKVESQKVVTDAISQAEKLMEEVEAIRKQVSTKKA